jgi:hypothetical protein
MTRRKPNADLARRANDVALRTGIDLYREGRDAKAIARDIGMSGFPTQLRRVIRDDIACEPDSERFWR